MTLKEIKRLSEDPHLIERCRAARESHGIKQVEVARLHGCSEAVVSRFEHGTRVPPVLLLWYIDYFHIKIGD